MQESWAHQADNPNVDPANLPQNWLHPRMSPKSSNDTENCQNAVVYISPCSRHFRCFCWQDLDLASGPKQISHLTSEHHDWLISKRWGTDQVNTSVLFWHDVDSARRVRVEFLGGTSVTCPFLIMLSTILYIFIQSVSWSLVFSSRFVEFFNKRRSLHHYKPSALHM